jgi:hypothetical protein
MARSNQAAYDSSSIDWAKIRRFALRVAGETKRVRNVRPGVEDHWVLEQRYWLRYDTGSGHMADEKTCTLTDYCLGGSGSLFVLVTQWEEVTPKGMAYFENRRDLQVRPMIDDDVMLFDFAPRHYCDNEQPKIDTNQSPDKRKLKYDSKGIGLSLGLKGLLSLPS